MHAPKKAVFREVSEGGFCTIDIGNHPTEFCFLIVATREENLQFLYQLAQATEQAIKYEILKGDSR